MLARSIYYDDVLLGSNIRIEIVMQNELNLIIDKAYYPIKLKRLASDTESPSELLLSRDLNHMRKEKTKSL